MDIKNCKLCDNCIKRQNVVEGIGNKNARIMFIFDHPGYRQNRTGIFRSDPNINRFLGYLTDYGFNEFNAYFTMLLKCKPTSNYTLKRGLDICTNAYLSREYMYGGKRKDILITVGRSVSDYMFPKQTYKYFKAYNIGATIIAIPNSDWFVKGGQMSINKLTYIEDFYNI